MAPDNILPEPNNLLEIIAVWVVPFIAYFLGVYIRKKSFPSKNSPPLMSQFLLAIPVCLVVVSPLIAALKTSFGAHVPTYLFTLGIIIEHGMILHETATKHLNERLAGTPSITDLKKA